MQILICSSYLHLNKFSNKKVLSILDQTTLFLYRKRHRKIIIIKNKNVYKKCIYLMSTKLHNKKKENLMGCHISNI